MSKIAQAFRARQTSIDAAREQAKQGAIETHFKTKRMNLDSFARRDVVAQKPGLDLAAFAKAARSFRLRARTGINKAVVAHYRKSPELLWVSHDGMPNDRAKAVMKTLERSATFGLVANDYALPAIPVGDDLEEVAAFEFSLTARALRYFSDALYGIVDPNRISEYHDFKNNFANYEKLLAALVTASQPGKLLEDAHPKDPAFATLKKELAALSGFDSEGTPSVEIASGTFINPYEYDSELENVVKAIQQNASEEILEKHADVLAEDHFEGKYSRELVALVRDVQKSFNLRPDGIIGKRTIRALTGGRKDNPELRRRKVLHAMERLRWHPSQLGSTHVMINQPAYRVALKKGGKTELAMNVVVGKTSNQTYFFHDKISYVEFNPYWGIPRSILVNEYLPKLRRNPGYLDNKGYELTDVRGRYLSSWDVDWWNVDEKFPYNVRQPPGPRNALGRLKIMFPNKHSIYMHDTPAKSLFKRQKRAYSHGCVRLAEPQKMAAAVLGTSISSVKRRIAEGVNQKTQLKSKIPVYVSYFTAWPNDAGKVQFYADIYGRDDALRKALKEERRVRGAGQRA